MCLIFVAKSSNANFAQTIAKISKNKIFDGKKKPRTYCYRS